MKADYGKLTRYTRKSSRDDLVNGSRILIKKAIRSIFPKEAIRKV